MTPETRTAEEKLLSENGVEKQTQKRSTAGMDIGESVEEQILEPKGRIAQETGHGSRRAFWITEGES